MAHRSRIHELEKSECSEMALRRRLDFQSTCAYRRTLRLRTHGFVQSAHRRLGSQRRLRRSDSVRGLSRKEDSASRIQS